MFKSERVILQGLCILIGKKWVHDHAVIIDNQVIHAIVPQKVCANYLPAKCYTFSQDDYLIPGLIDLHVHGSCGKDVMEGSPSAFKIISESLAKDGVTGFLATTMTSSNANIETVLQCEKQNESGAKVLGVHLEGPFLAKSKAGAQSADYLQLPNIDLITQWQAIAQGAIKIVTLAPELPNAIPFIKALRKMNIIASIGHTNATYEEITNAIAAGCSQATHLFNAMSALHHRAPGASGALLLSKKISAELIVDGHHLHPAIVQLALKVKGKNGLLLVTDAMCAQCLGDGEYTLGGQTVIVSQGKATLKDGTLAGSTLSLMQAIKNMVELTACTLAEAIQMATLNPARVLKLSHRKGKIAVGYDADLAVVNSNLEVKLTLRGGREIFSSIS